MSTFRRCRHAEHADARIDEATGWIISGDEAWLPEEWESHVEPPTWQRHRSNRRRERYATDPAYRERTLRWTAEWKRRRKGAAA